MGKTTTRCPPLSEPARTGSWSLSDITGDSRDGAWARRHMQPMCQVFGHAPPGTNCWSWWSAAPAQAHAASGADVERQHLHGRLNLGCSTVKGHQAPPWTGYQQATQRGPQGPIIPTSCNMTTQSTPAFCLQVSTVRPRVSVVPPQAFFRGCTPPRPYRLQSKLVAHVAGPSGGQIYALTASSCSRVRIIFSWERAMGRFPLIDGCECRGRRCYCIVQDDVCAMPSARGSRFRPACIKLLRTLVLLACIVGEGQPIKALVEV